MTTLLTVLFIIFGILQIILFFKLWVMTNDISKLRDHFFPVSDFSYNMRKLLLLGDKEKARELIINKFFDRLVNGDYTFDEAKNNIKDEFDKIGEKLPEQIENLNSKDDFYSLF